MTALKQELEFAPVGEYMDDRRRKLGISFADLCRKADVSDTQVRSIMRGRGNPNSDTLRKLAYVLQTTAYRLQALFVGEELPFTEDWVKVPVYSVDVSCGPGGFDDDQYANTIYPMTYEFIRQEMRANPDSICAFRATGPSMEPKISSGDLVFVDRSQVNNPTDGAYVFCLDGKVHLKNLQWLPGGRVLVKSENPVFEPYPVDLGKESLNLVGRAVFSNAGRRL